MNTPVFVVAGITMALMALSPSAAVAQDEPDLCIPALTVTGRSRLSKLTVEERETYAYKMSCEFATTEHGLDTNFKMAQSILGTSAGRYASRKDYCTAERSNYAGRSADFLDISTVVDSSVRNWLACRELTSTKIRVKPQINRELVSISLARGGEPSVAEIRGVTAVGATCSAFIDQPDGPAKRVPLDEDSNYPLPRDHWLEIRCRRSPENASSPNESLVYPEATISIGTTQNSFTMHLEREPVAVDTWASDIKQNIADLQAEFGRRLATKLDTTQMPEGDYVVLAGQSGCPTGFKEVNALIRSLVIYDEGTSLANYFTPASFGKSRLECHGRCDPDGTRQRPNGVSNAAFIGDLNLVACVRQAK